MNSHGTCKWIYSGFWGLLTKWFRLPELPPTLPQQAGEDIMSFQPSGGWLSYNKLHFWIVLLIIDIAILGSWIALYLKTSYWALVLSPLFLIAGILPDIFAYLSIYLKYDSTWYVISDRSLRIRRGIWILEEITITFENIQNIKVHQGPLQRYYNFADIVIETAGGGGGNQPGDSGGAHKAVLAGIENPDEIRNTLLLKLEEINKNPQIEIENRSTVTSSKLSSSHIKVLREIRDELKSSVA